MKYVVNNIVLPPDADNATIRKAVSEKLGCHLRGLRIEIVERSWVRLSKGGAIRYKIVAETNEVIRQTSSFPAPEEIITHFPVRPMKYRPVVVGFGIRGMIAAYVLAKLGLKPFVIEKGDSLKNKTTETNVYGGEGGISVFTGLLLSLETLDPSLRNMLEEDGIVFSGMDRYRFINPLQVKSLINQIRGIIVNLGGEIHFRSKYIGVSTFLGKMKGIYYEEGGKKKLFKTTKVLFANKDQDDTFYLGCAIESSQTSFDQCVYGKRHVLSGWPLYCVESTSEFGKENCVILTGFKAATVIDVGSRSRRCCHTIQFAGKGHNLVSYIGVKIDKEEASRIINGAYVSDKPFQIPTSLLSDFLDGKSPLRIGTVKPANVLQTRLTSLSSLYGEPFSTTLKKGIIRYSTAFPYLNSRDAICAGIILIRGNEKSEPIKKNGMYYSRIAAEKSFDLGALATSGFKTALLLCQE